MKVNDAFGIYFTLNVLSSIGCRTPAYDFEVCVYYIIVLSMCFTNNLVHMDFRES